MLLLSYAIFGRKEPVQCNWLHSEVKNILLKISTEARS